MLHSRTKIIAYEKKFTGYHNNFSKSINGAETLS